MSEMPKKQGSRPNDRSKKRLPKGALDQDQKQRQYYYDDAHGYEAFDPESESDDEEDESGEAA